jgi:hypothetical protein
VFTSSFWKHLFQLQGTKPKKIFNLQRRRRKKKKIHLDMKVSAWKRICFNQCIVFLIDVLANINKGKIFCPFPVMAKIGNVSYMLKFPDEAKIHHVFHISQLKPFKECHMISICHCLLQLQILVLLYHLLPFWNSDPTNKALRLYKRCMSNGRTP